MRGGPPDRPLKMRVRDKLRVVITPHGLAYLGNRHPAAAAAGADGIDLAASDQDRGTWSNS